MRQASKLDFLGPLDVSKLCYFHTSYFLTVLVFGRGPDMILFGATRNFMGDVEHDHKCHMRNFSLLHSTRGAAI
jgi:hypothetical protein